MSRVQTLGNRYLFLKMKRIQHAALFTADYAATADFYRTVFDAEVPEACTQPSVVRIGAVVLHVFERGSIRGDWAPAHLHHIALEAGDLDEFVTVRDRLLAHGACDEQVIDFGVGAHVSLLATDPDGGMLEVLVAVEDRATLPFAVVPHQ
jgi:catechol 2,3-dioxygenase-like lactoylglutathione lyase family enzyme